MDAREFLGLEATSDGDRWLLPVVPGLCTSANFLYGGCGLAAGIEALEGTTDRPVVWATSQYLSFARAPSTMALKVSIGAGGGTVSQARVVGTVDGKEILTVNAALGRRSLDFGGEWATRPDVPPPAECPPRRWRHSTENSIMSRLELRLADGRDVEALIGEAGTGRSALWCRLDGLPDMSGATLAVLGDFIPFGIGQASGHAAGGTSLDNTLRVVDLEPTEWVLADVRIHAINHGFAHGVVHLWSESGRLLATASQSTIVRLWDQPPT